MMGGCVRSRYSCESMIPDIYLIVDIRSRMEQSAKKVSLQESKQNDTNDGWWRTRSTEPSDKKSITSGLIKGRREPM